MNKLREECGVFGIYNNKDAAALTALGLHALQHRGQEGCGIITFVDPQNAQAALNDYDDHWIEGKWVAVKECIPRTKPKEPPPVEPQAERYGVWIGGIPPYLSQKALFRNCKRYGQIRNTHLVLGEYGQSRGFAFIEFVEREAQQWCLNDTLSYHGTNGENTEKHSEI